MSSNLICNNCYNHVDGIAYLTSCNHFYCPDCTKSIFQKSFQCPVCHFCLQKHELKEIMIGIEINDPKEFLFQNILQSTSWYSIIENFKKCSLVIVDIQSFISSQLFLQNSLSNHAKNSIQLDLEAQSKIMHQLNEKIIEQNHENQSINLIFEQKLQDKNKELCELQDAYKEKLRKCLAWEKAYNNIRNQINVGNSNNNFGTIESLPLSLMQQNEEIRHSAPYYNPDMHTKSLKTEISTYRRKFSTKEQLQPPHVQSKFESSLHSLPHTNIDQSVTPFQLLQQQARNNLAGIPFNINVTNNNNRSSIQQSFVQSNHDPSTMDIPKHIILPNQIQYKQHVSKGIPALTNMNKSIADSQQASHTTYLHKYKTSFFEDN